jgi:hypothetical protein
MCVTHSPRVWDVENPTLPDGKSSNGTYGVVQGNKAYVLKTHVRWMQLAGLAANELDPEKLVILIKKIDQLLRQKQHRLGLLPRAPKPTE